MAKRRSGRMRADDQENVGFGLPERVADLKAGFQHEVAAEERATGHDVRRRPTDRDKVPHESLAVRLGKLRKGG